MGYQIARFKTERRDRKDIRANVCDDQGARIRHDLKVGTCRPQDVGVEPFSHSRDSLARVFSPSQNFAECSGAGYRKIDSKNRVAGHDIAVIKTVGK